MRITILLLVAALTGCASLNQMMGVPTNIGNGYKIDQERQIWGGGVKIEYRDHDLLRRDAAERAANRMTEFDPEGIPRGRIFITYDALNIKEANAKWLEYVVLKDGAEVLRKQGRDQVPNYDVGANITYWRSTDALDIPVDPPFTLAVIKNADNKRDTFTISRP